MMNKKEIIIQITGALLATILTKIIVDKQTEKKIKDERKNYICYMKQVMESKET